VCTEPWIRDTRTYTESYQQELYKQVRKITEQASSNRERWLAAADSFRIPYFDTTLGVSGGELPDFFTNSHVQVTGPDGISYVVPNPLFQYDFHPVSQQDFDGKVCHVNKVTQWFLTQYSGRK
jgi:tyrosinase